MSHGDSVIETPEGFKVIGGTKSCPIAAMSSDEKKIYTLQFHPEVTHTPHGMEIIKNFAFHICKARKDWNIHDWQKEMIKEIKVTVKDRKVFLLVSGGVDSTVSFALLEKALGKDKVFGLHIDNGLMRKNEVTEVQRSLKIAGFTNLEVYDASNEFLDGLKEICEPEKKRQIIGNLFLDIQDKVASKLNLNPSEWILGQGTIYPDTIETGGTPNADIIKTHHNRVPRVEKLIKENKIIEPIKDLYKDEVRLLGENLGLPSKLVWRQPFPGPGLGVRVLCNNQKPSDVSKVTEKIKKSFPNFNLTVLSIKSVGVQGDMRTYAHPLAMEVNINELNQENVLEIFHVSPTLTNQFKEINRVILRIDNSNNKLSEAKLKEAYITKERLDLLREVDSLVQSEVLKLGLERDIWQFPVVLVPYGINSEESIILRPVSSQEAMTAKFYPLPVNILKDLAFKIAKIPGISFIFFDLTNKPPGTIEWE